MKKGKSLDLLLFFLLGIGVGIAFGMSSVLLIRQNKKEETVEYSYEVVLLDSCDTEEKLYYQEQDKNIYLYCINSIKVKDRNNLLELKNYVQNNPDELETMMEQMTIVTQYEDGGTILYRDENQLSEEGFSILNCSTLMGNKDIYIGPKDMKFEEGFCQSE